MRLVPVTVVSIILLCSWVLLVEGCAHARVRGDCPYCGHPREALPVGAEVNCPACGGLYEVYPQTYPAPAPAPHPFPSGRPDSYWDRPHYPWDRPDYSRERRH